MKCSDANANAFYSVQKALGDHLESIQSVERVLNERGMVLRALKERGEYQEHGEYRKHEEHFESLEFTNCLDCLLFGFMLIA